MNKPNKIVVVVDTQVDFMLPTGALYVPTAEKLIGPGVEYLAKLDPTEVAAVLFTFDTHGDEFIGSPENIGDETAGIPGFPIHCVKGTAGWSNVFNELIVPDDIDILTLEKGVFDMWAEDDTLIKQHGKDPVLRDSYFGCQDVDTAVIFGVASDYCVMWAVAGLLARGFKVEIVEHLTAGIQRDMTTTIAQEFPGQSVRLV